MIIHFWSFDDALDQSVIDIIKEHYPKYTCINLREISRECAKPAFDAVSSLNDPYLVDLEVLQKVYEDISERCDNMYKESIDKADDYVIVVGSFTGDFSEECSEMLTKRYKLFADKTYLKNVMERRAEETKKTYTDKAIEMAENITNTFMLRMHICYLCNGWQINDHFDDLTTETQKSYFDDSYSDGVYTDTIVHSHDGLHAFIDAVINNS